MRGWVRPRKEERRAAVGHDESLGVWTSTEWGGDAFGRQCFDCRTWGELGVDWIWQKQNACAACSWQLAEWEIFILGGQRVVSDICGGYNKWTT
jgi:hypothetical protein